MSVNGTGGQSVDGPDVTTVARVDDNDPTHILTDVIELAVRRTLDDGGGQPGAANIDESLTLTGTWNGQSVPVVLAVARSFRWSS